MSKPSLVVIDDFAPDAKQVRAYALAGEFGPVKYDGHEYAGINPDAPLDMDRRISQALGKDVQLTMSFFRATGERDVPTSWIHADAGCARYAAVWYLNTPGQCVGGTRLWQHRLFGDRLPNPDEIAGFGLSISEAVETLQKDAHSEDAWIDRGLVHMKWNRLVIYPTEMFHSPYPKTAFGSTPEDSRLVWVGFFN